MIELVESSEQLGVPTKPTDDVLLGPSEASSLMKAFEEVVLHDKRCVGLSRYLADIRVYWSRSIPTACAGHGFIFFNPEFYDKLPPQTRITIMAHEVSHLYLKHLERAKHADPYYSNVAQDHVINLALEADGFTFEGLDIIGGVPMDPKYKSWSSEMVYNHIYKSEDPKDKPTLDQMANMPSTEQIEDMIEEIVNGEGKTLDEQIIEADKAINKASGSNPGSSASTEGMRLERTKTTVMIIGATYHEIFKDYLTDPLSGGKRTHMRPNRRQHGLGSSKLKLPGRFPKRGGPKNRLKHLVYALDISGSINQKQAQQFHDSVRTVKEVLNPSALTILFFNTRIVLERTFTDKQPYGTIDVQGSGGTDLTDVYKRVRELDPEALVIFTDLCVNIPPKPTWESIWLIPEARFQVPSDIYGKVYLIPEI